MKTKRRATPSPSNREMTSPTANLPNLSVEKGMTQTLVPTTSVDPDSSNKKARFDNASTRRSQRIRNAVYHQRLIRDIEPVIQILDPTGSEKDDANNAEELNQQPEPSQSRMHDIEPVPPNQNPAGSEMENEDDPSQENSLEPEELIQKTNKTSVPGNKSEIRYRQLYVKSRKKLEELTRANNELSLKLAVAEGKLEVYEKGSGIISSIIGKTKDAIMASALSKATEQLLAHTTSHIKPNKNLRAAVAKKKPVANLRKK
uniref:Uncharacterized protein n=2 Tax=Kalanchoe fedtschenkoi TaxID=63787 RepID=A0A7N0U1L4_KALFE